MRGRRERARLALRGGLEAKFHLVADGNGTPLAVEVSAGQVHESRHAESVIGSATAVCPAQVAAQPRMQPVIPMGATSGALAGASTGAPTAAGPRLHSASAGRRSVA